MSAAAGGVALSLLSELEGETPSHHEGYWLRALAAQMFSSAGAEPSLACEGDEPAAIRGLISDGLGIGLLPTIARETASVPKVAWIRVNAANCQCILSHAHPQLRSRPPCRCLCRCNGRATRKPALRI
jgi:DNA-binding transcriptional LysR family regulator